MKFAVSKGETELSELTARIFDIKGRGAAEAAKKAEAALLKANPHIADLTKIPEGTLIVIPDLTDNPPVKGTQTAAPGGDLEEPLKLSLKELKTRIEIECIREALELTGGNITKAAVHLGMKRPRLSQLIKQYKIVVSGDGENQ